VSAGAQALAVMAFTLVRGSSRYVTAEHRRVPGLLEPLGERTELGGPGPRESRQHDLPAVRWMAVAGAIGAESVGPDSEGWRE
jgi:hypothetical protein